MTLLIKNGRLVDPSQKLDKKTDVLIEDGRIAKIGSIAPPRGADVIDAGGCVVLPGLIDLHVHLREPGQEHKETIKSGTRAAVAGGFTSVCAMANTVPPNDERPVTEMMIAEARRSAACRVYPIGAVSRGLQGEELTEMADLQAAGCIAFSDDGMPVTNTKLMRSALEYSKMLGLPVIVHEQDAHLSGGAVMHEGYYSTLLGLKGAPAAAEAVMTARDVELVELAGGHLHVAHISTIGSIEAVRRARVKGLHVTSEATPHHIALTDENLQSFSTDFKMNPPLRSEDHRLALIEAIKDGTIDVIATDHAPHHMDEKRVEFDLAPFGVTGLETSFAVCYEVLVKGRHISLDRLVELMSCAPARIFNLPGGTLREGSPGDVTVVNLDTESTFDSFRSRASNSPFRGRTFSGKVVATIVGGDVRYSDIALPKESGTKAAGKKSRSKK
jgi:dihydroorotase